jgi:uncharacterized protein YecE (DUF72 family)
MNLRLGCGSWTDDEYRDVLYPPRLPKTERLAMYATWFNHVEVNATDYAIPSATTVAKWQNKTPPGFTFSVKLLRAFAENPAKAAQDAALVGRFLDAMEPLVQAGKLSAFLLVLPPRFGPEKRRLEELDMLAEKFRAHTVAVELRHKGWVADEQRSVTFDYFRSRGLVWVAVDMPRIEESTIMPEVDEVTHPELAYLRLHGRNPDWLQAANAEERHAYAYDSAELNEIAIRVRRFSTKARCVHVIANNHAKDFAPKTALALQDLLGTRLKDRLPEQGDLFRRD